MDDQEQIRRLNSLEARMNRMETMMQQLLSNLTSSRAQVDRITQMQTMLQELRHSPDIYPAGINPGAVTPQERPEMGAIQEALLAGDNLKAIKLYRELYGVSLQEAAAALRITLHHSR